MALLTHPLATVADYVDYFSRQKLPVLRHTMREFETMREEIDRVSSKHVASIVLSDPLMTMKLLSYLETHRPVSQNHDITTIDRAIIMMGLSPFFETFKELTTVEETLAAHPKALVGVLKVIGRARRAAKYAREWAVIRHDLDVDEITVAALLRQATDIICWIFAPDLTQQVFALQQQDRTLRSADAQRQVFGVTASEIQYALIQAWKLPDLLVHLFDESRSDHPRVRTIKLAADFTRHVAHGWEDAALPDDIEAISDLLHMSPEALLRRLGAPDEALARFLPATD
ncbi:HDOD domain-containing protein [Azoarcus sp. L1K30]|uniref:HDOD domain-containing protein n=1 Tax=Azoarcus sp. L1K30 TaxID=2820277 RepID=UPI001B822CA4|nr:HDOD domain-containing protein [Azoarcus sp. L1K30]MBR0568462.1 HDOD domain-containing protein [Azoarcus sp. L1K30]